MQAEERQSDVVGVSYFRLLQVLREQGLEPRTQHELSLAFPEDDVASHEGTSVRPVFMGLLGVAGALPYHYTERIASAADEGPREFLDMLSGRALELFDAAWRKHRLPRDAFMGLLLALGGLRDPALAQYAGLTRRATVSAQSLERALSEYLGVAVRVEQFVGGWQVFAPAYRNALGRVCATLGRDLALGEREWRCDQGLRVHVGPVGAKEYTAFLPRQAGARALASVLGGITGAAQRRARGSALGGAQGGTLGGTRGEALGVAQGGAQSGMQSGAQGGALGGAQGAARRETRELARGEARGDVEVCVRLAADCVRGARLDGAVQLGYNAFVLTSEENEPRSELRYQL
ncbi:MAG TPA: type VI secretion system baseplate subunit TssG [Pseudoduganella sp.]